MHPITLDDLLPLEEYLARRDEFFEANLRYCDQYRRVRVGPHAILLFENRQTLWFRIQEILRVTRLREPAWIQRELDVFNRLLPRVSQLQAALRFTGSDPPASSTLSIRLVLGEIAVPARLASSRPEDRAFGTSHWLEFPVSGADRKLFADFHSPAWIDIECEGYRASSSRLVDDVRQSLLDDLDMSDRAAA